MHLLILADTTLSGQELPHRNTYTEQFVRRLERAGHQVVVSYHLPMTLQRAARLLSDLPLHRYDLILLQLGNLELQYPPQNAEVSLHRRLLNTPVALPPSFLRNRLLAWLRFQQFRLTARRKRTGWRAALERQLENVLYPVQLHGHRTILITPFPHRKMEHRWMRQQGAQLFFEMGRRIGVSVFNTHAVVQERDEYFSDPGSDGGCLSASTHELLGNTLYDFYRGVPVYLAKQ